MPAAGVAGAYIRDAGDIVVGAGVARSNNRGGVAGSLSRNELRSLRREGRRKKGLVRGEGALALQCRVRLNVIFPFFILLQLHRLHEKKCVMDKWCARKCVKKRHEKGRKKKERGGFVASSPAE